MSELEDSKESLGEWATLLPLLLLLWENETMPCAFTELCDFSSDFVLPQFPGPLKGKAWGCVVLF